MNINDVSVVFRLKPGIPRDKWAYLRGYIDDERGDWGESVYKMSLHSFASEMGPHLNMGSISPIVDNEVKIIREN